jgi:hypothetical protein
MECAEAAAWVTAIATVVLAGGVAFAATQASAARNAVKAQGLMRLFQEWRDPETYRSMTYIHRLRNQWKGQAPVSGWQRLAEEWVRTHEGNDCVPPYRSVSPPSALVGQVTPIGPHLPEEPQGLRSYGRTLYRRPASYAVPVT